MNIFPSQKKKKKKNLVALKLLGQKQGFLTRLLVAWRGLCLHNACFSLALFS